MEILERNYSDCLQTYSFSEGNESDNRVKILLRWNLLSRLSKLIEGKLSKESKVSELIPRTHINITKITNPEISDKSMYLSELKVDGMNFPTVQDSPEDSLAINLDNMGISIPKDQLDNKLSNFYKNKITSKPFNLLNLEERNLSENRITEKEFSFIEDSMYAEDIDDIEHYKMVRAVALLAMHKHLTENPSSTKERLVKGIDNLCSSIDDIQEKKEIKDYLLIYIDKPASRPMMVKEAELIIKTRSDKAGKGIPLWVIVTIISLLLIGGIVYSQRDRIKAALEASNDIKNSGESKPDFNRKKTFLQMLFTPSGRTAARDWVNGNERIRRRRDERNEWKWKKEKYKVDDKEDKNTLKDILNRWGK